MENIMKILNQDLVIILAQDTWLTSVLLYTITTDLTNKITPHLRKYRSCYSDLVVTNLKFSSYNLRHKFQNLVTTLL